MERKIEKTLEEIKDTETILGCVLADRTGLCLGAKGSVSSDSAGMITAITDQIGKLEPNSAHPIVTIQNDSRQWLIQRQGPVVGAIYKRISA